MESPLTEADTRLFDAYLPLVNAVAWEIFRSQRGRVEFEDLVQDGAIGLLHALRRYRPELNSSFGAWARSRIRGAIIDGLRRRVIGWRELHKLIAGQCRGCDLFQAADLELVRCALRSDCPRVVFRGHVSLDAAGQLAVVEPDEEDYFLGLRLHTALSRLKHRERLILLEHYMRDRSLHEIAESLQLSACRVCQIHRQVLRKLRRYLMEPAAVRPAAA